MHLKQLFSGAILLISLATSAQVHRKGVTPLQRGPRQSSKTADYQLSQFIGKWQEYERTDEKGNVVDFSDSIQLNFIDSNKVQTRTSISNSMTMNGDADIDEDNNLTVAADSYTIKSFGKNELVLDDDVKYVHKLKKVDHFWYESLGKITAKQDTYDSTVVAISSVLGKWSVYKKQAKPGAVTNDMQLIKYLNILNKTNDNTATGDVTFYQGQSSQQLPCTVSLSGSQVKIVAGSNTWIYTVFQADGSNFIFGNSGLMYFSKSDK